MKRPDEAEWRQSLTQVHAQTKQRIKAANERIQEIAQTVEIATLFSAIAGFLLIAPADQMSETTHGSVPAKLELLAFTIYPFIGASSNTDITPQQTIECISALEDLFISQTILGSFSENIDKNNNPIDRIKNEVEKNTRIVRGSAYPEQTAREILEIQGDFEQWFINKIGLGPTKAHDILWAVSKSREDAIQTTVPIIISEANDYATLWKQNRHSKEANQSSELSLLRSLKDKKSAWSFAYVRGLNQSAVELLPVRREDIEQLIPSLTAEEWKVLIHLIGLTPDSRSSISDPVEVRQKPLFVFSEEQVILLDLANAMDVLWDVFDKLAKNDQKFYERYQKRRAQWLEETIMEYLSKVFPQQNIYRGLSYLDPDKTDGSHTELDGAILWGPFLVLVEAKAKQFRLEAQLGDVGRLRTDLKENIEDAFEQARRAERYIAKTDNPIFIEITTKRKLTIDKSNIRRTYLLTISQHHMAGLATRLASLRDLLLFRDAEYPIAMSIADLETVTEFCAGPDVLLHYIERRLEVQKASEDILADELDFFGAYLDTRLQPYRLWKREKQSVNAVWLSGWSEQFDAWMMYRRGELKSQPSIKLDVPGEIHEILAELRKREGDDAARWIAFTLLDMSDSILNSIAKALQEIRTAQLTPGMFRRLTFQDDDTVISIVASNEQPETELYQRTQIRTVLEKYRRKAQKSIGFGIWPLNKLSPFESATWAEGEWQYDKELEQALVFEPPYLPAPKQKLPGRNEPCICGSKKKFKYCCLRKIEAMR